MELEKKPHEICAQNELQDLSKRVALLSWHLWTSRLLSSPCVHILLSSAKPLSIAPL